MTDAIVCEPSKGCADPHPHRWYCMKGHDGAPPGVCPLPPCRAVLRALAGSEPGGKT